MNIVLGASGQVGSAVVEALIKKGQPVKAIIKDPKKRNNLENKGVDVAIADLFDLASLQKAFENADTIFLLTPENPASQNIVADTDRILHNYREAIRLSGVKKVVGLSSIGAQHSSGTGYLALSYKLEHCLQDLPIEQTFIRPAYYYSNWMAYFDMIQEHGVLPTFFPPDLSIPMAAPVDVAENVANVITENAAHELVYELVGQTYSTEEIAAIFAKHLNRKVDVQPIPREQWKDTLLSAGFSDDAADNLILMTAAVIDGKARPEKDQSQWVQLPTSFENYLAKIIK